MDEPTAGMGPFESAELMQLIANIVHDRQLGVLFTEHDMDIVFEHANRIMVLDRGHIIAVGSPEDIRRNARVQRIYLGSGMDVTESP